jgi:hypothetical protein
MRQPLLFIIGDEKRAVRQAQHWAATAPLAPLPVAALPVAGAAAAA